MTTSGSLDCPARGAEFDQRVEHGVTVDHSPGCGSVWLDPGELEQLTDHGGHQDRDIDIEEGEEEEGGILGTSADTLGGGEGEFEAEDEFEAEAGFEKDEAF